MFEGVTIQIVDRSKAVFLNCWSAQEPAWGPGPAGEKAPPQPRQETRPPRHRASNASCRPFPVRGAFLQRPLSPDPDIYIYIYMYGSVRIKVLGAATNDTDGEKSLKFEVKTHGKTILVCFAQKARFFGLYGCVKGFAFVPFSAFAIFVGMIYFC